MHVKYAIVTGASRGLGESVAKLFMEQGIHVIGLSRRENKALHNHAEKQQASYTHVTCDLGQTEQVKTAYSNISEHLPTDGLDTLYLINNAAVVEPIDQAMRIDPDDLVNHVHINTIAPMILANLLLQKAVQIDVPLICATVTSGAADRPTYGWSAYCSTKAAMDIYTKTVALEQEKLQTDNKVIAFSPGIMDTNMQTTIRQTREDAFVDRETFRHYKAENMLRDTETVASVLIDILLDKANIINGKIYKANDYL
ncbi:MAG TPA: (S)-benzoin forming benzil reductase [Bacillota bacterium]|nr:(S)-benzoin forming benzil reductase [Bacillota bacterium]